MLSNARLPVIGFAAPSGTGKTTLLTKLLPLLTAQGLRVGIIKHAHHDFDIDLPGKDSYALRLAGARQTLIGSSRRIALIMEQIPETQACLNDLVGYLDQSRLDVILVEGFKHEAFAKIALHRTGTADISLQDTNLIAVATDDPYFNSNGLPKLDINKPDELSDFIMDFIASALPPA